MIQFMSNLNCCFKASNIVFWLLTFFFFTRVNVRIKIKDNKIWKIQTTFFFVQQCRIITALKIINSTVPRMHFYTAQVSNPQKGLNVIAYDVIDIIAPTCSMNVSCSNKIRFFLVPILLVEGLAVYSIRISA